MNIIKKVTGRLHSLPFTLYPSESGFTLIELITIIAILGVLAVVLITVIDPATQIKKANDTKRKTDLGEIQKALELYYEDHGHYPPQATTSGMCGNVNVIHDESTNTDICFGSPWSPYISTLPKDPTTHKYAYFVSNDLQSYWVYAYLERQGNDPQACNGGNPCQSMLTYGRSPIVCGLVSGQGLCNYAVTSANQSP